ncbi:GMC family oxidoreductase [Hoeflea prorocentri]|uniref:GMC family oxidoreductase N-terminal domain-containing protein n=1 Tax=Hoeflea prorocentri TaxID=1922333 RepID=A0A9X3UFG5_9HYPH|nr:GMC family oxidoreductase N-terminal domain-containing protein [Hoeflea prorocentri]MCY6379644.1 GMC family oxidoreductase N-terminal domain-containing protein [Hoeflea prorocentri]MDA5397444.1 GMC family oxidoreductase N-terminal domain-containing protein [Hoeflea prorocentri]
MSYFSSNKPGALEEAVLEFNSGAMSRRSFIKKVMALGVTAGMAGALATSWSGKALAQSTTSTDKPAGEFDYIVIGTGSAGAAVVHQLAKTGASILVLEAGRNDDLEEVHDSRLWAASLGTDATKWFETTPQNFADGRTHLWPRGNVLGGTSALNAMIFARGHRSDWDSWAYDGNAGWSFEEMLPHFMAMETYEPGGDNRGTSGPIFISQPQDEHKHEGAKAFMDACSSLGYKETPSLNSERMSGQAWVDFNIKDQRRQSSATAFLRPVMDMKNVTVLTDAPVQKLNLDGTKCTGVTYLHNDEPVSVNAAKEVVLSAGAIDSPKLLMLSGIGIAEDLKAVGIDAVVDLPVGQGLQDHVLGAGVNYEASGPVPVSHYNHSEVYMWERSDSRLTAPDMIMLYVSVPFASTGHKLDYTDGYCILSGVARPHSRGFVKLQSNLASDAPLIEANYLKEEQDWVAYRRATEICREIGADKAYDPFRKRESLPQKDGDLTDAEWREFLGKSLNTYFHPTSTCQMGVGDAAVVDPELKVYGIEGLRVADASVMPSITTSNTNAPSMVIGWKAGDMIAQSA